MADNVKKCPRCGAELPREASFCPRCTATLAERRAVVMPHTGKRRLRLLAVGFAAALTAGLAVWLWPTTETEPQRPDGTADPVLAADPVMDAYTAACQTYYTGADGREYHLFTARTPAPQGSTEPVGYHSELIPANDGASVDCPATVIAEDAVTQEYVQGDFIALLDSWEVTVNAPEGVGRVTLREAQVEAENSPALLYRRLRADTTCTHNEVVWTLYMKNGDEIQLTMTVEFEEQTTLYFGQQDAPLDTAQELQALLDRLAQEYDADTAIIVELPGVTYDRPITVGCAVTLRGTGTVFAAPVTVSPLADTKRAIACVHFQETAFTGGGVGTGITAGAPTYLENCRVTGWEVGTLAVSGGWVYLYEGYVGGNDVGARYDSAYSSSYTYTIRRIDFMNNGTALELLCMPPRAYAVLEDCRFRGNDVDVANPGSYRIEVGDGTEVTL